MLMLARRSPSEIHEKKSKRQRIALNTPPNESPAQASGDLLAETPLEILLEIFKYLDPAGLLALSRTRRSLRAILLSRPASFLIWKNAFSLAQPTPPPCPDDLALPQYANLLYGNCYYCDTKDRLRNAWLCYMRICDVCLKENFVEIHVGRRSSKVLVEILPHYTEHTAGVGYDRWENRVMYPRAEYDLKTEELRKTSRDKKLYDEYVSREAKKLTERRKEYTALCTWETNFKLSKIHASEDRRRARRDAFGQHIANLGEGYKTVFDRLRMRGPVVLEGALPEISGIDPLTSDEWEASRPRVVEALQLWQQKFEDQDRSKLIADRTNKLLGPVYDYYISHHRSEQLFTPQLQQLAEMEPFKSLLYDTPSNVQLAQGDFLAHLDILPQLVEAWKEEAVRLLLGLLGIVESEHSPSSPGAKGKGNESPLNSSILEKATSIFKCTRCSKSLLYPAILSHSCPITQPGQPQCLATLSHSCPITQLGQPPCRWDEFQAHEEASRYAKVIIRILGEDPEIVTWNQLQEAKQRLECIRCRHKVSRKSVNKNNCLVMNWHQAILHELEKHSDKDEDRCKIGWRLLDAQSLPAVYSKEIKGARYLPSLRAWREDHDYCVQCGLCDIQDGQVVYPRSSNWGPVLEGAKTCNSLMTHDLAITGVFRRLAAPSDLSFWPFPVRIPESS